MEVGVAPECGPILLQTPGYTRNQPPYSFVGKPMIFLGGRFELESTRSLIMEWVTPRHEEVDLNCEVSSYANAEL
jgi:hypothetical protein